MSSTTAVLDHPAPAAAPARPDVVNDFSIVVATPNGSGSQTANISIIRSIFRMGIPVNGKNLFPSNIQGLPTWYTIRISKDGYIARREGTEILVAFNEKTAEQDLASLPAGGICIHPLEWKFARSRTDVTYYGVPVKEFVKASGAEDKIKNYIANMVYVGALAYLLGIDLEDVKGALHTQFGGKTKPINLNLTVVKMAYDWPGANLTKTDPFRVEPMDKTQGKIMIEGNIAAALGSVFGGVQVVAWYPITPATSVAEALNEYLPQLRMDENGKPTFAVLQSEDEIAAIGTAIGAGWAGARSMTSTSGPGLSLMTEYAGMGFFAEVPVVIWDVQRMGPSTGLPTRVAQGDVLMAYTMGHGDTRHVVLLPSSVSECFDFGIQAFDLAERLQTPVFVLSDLDIGMNLWMSDPFNYPEKPLDRGKVLTAEDIQRLGGAQPLTRAYLSPKITAPPTSPAAPDIMPRRCTASGQTTGSRTWPACTRSTIPRAPWFPNRWWMTRRLLRSASSRMARPTRLCWRRVTGCASRGSKPTTCACVRCPSRRSYLRDRTELRRADGRDFVHGTARVCTQTAQAHQVRRPAADRAFSHRVHHGAGAITSWQLHFQPPRPSPVRTARPGRTAISS